MPDDDGSTAPPPAPSTEPSPTEAPTPPPPFQPDLDLIGYIEKGKDPPPRPANPDIEKRG